MDGDVGALIREMDISQRNFDQWADQEIELIHTMASVARESSHESHAALKALEEEAATIDHRLHQIKLENEVHMRANRVELEENSRIRDDLRANAKELKYLTDLHIVLQKKKERLAQSSQNLAEATDLKTFEALYGLSVSRKNDCITFSFRYPEATVILQEDENRNWRFLSAPPEVTRLEKDLIPHFNQNGDLLGFLTGIRRALIRI
jgi:hypothetical protein